MLNILFWNLHQNVLEELIAECIFENNIDIVVVAEFQSIDFSVLEKQLGELYSHIVSIQDDKKVAVIAKKTIAVSTLQQQARYNLYHVQTALNKYVLAAIHLEDRKNYKTADRTFTIKALVNDICTTETSFECENTIVIGDFNANPYDEELLSKYSFNAVLFKKVIENNELTNPCSKKIKRFYNPIIHYISEDTEMYGSYYYDNDYNTPYWNCLDQVLVRKSLINNISHINYLKRIDSHDLLLNSIPNRSISDHLPLVVKLEEI